MSRHVGIVGTFDVANYGDLLFPIIASHELGRRLGDVTLTPYSYGSRTADDWPYDVRSITQLEDDVEGLDALVVGGGHLVRFDPDVAPGYGPPRDDLHHPTAYWLWPSTLAAGRGVPVLWNALGASEDLPPWSLPLVRLAMGAAGYRSVRDERSRDAVQAAWPDADVDVVPDTAFALAEVLGAAGDAPAAAAREALRTAGIDGPYVVVQASRHLEPRAAQVDRLLAPLRASGMAVLELPISPALGDRPGSVPLSDAPAQLADWPSPLTIASIVRGADAVVAHSFHLSVTALTAGVPVVRAAAPVGTKYAMVEGLAEVRSLAEDVDDLVAVVLDGAAQGPSAEVVQLRDRVAAHWDRIAAAVEVGRGDVPTTLGDVGRWLPQRLTEVVEALPTPEELGEVRAQRERRTGELEHLRGRVTDLERELGRRTEDHQRRLRAAESQVDQARGDANRWRDEFHRLRRRRVVRAGLRLAEMAEPVVAAVRRARSDDGDTTEHRPATEEEAAELTAVLREESPGSERTEGPLVSICVLNRDGAQHLERLVAGLARTTYRSFELVVVDNDSSDESVELLRAADIGAPLTVIENDENASFSDGNNQAVAASTGELVLLLNNDIEPVADGWLGHMVDVLEERDAAAVGARLVYPRRPGLGSNQGDTVFPDLTLQHRGVHFTPSADGIPVGRNLGAGEDPRADVARAITSRPAVTAACMLVPRATYDDVGGLTSGYRYGTEDVDLCLKLRRAGGEIVYDGEAVLWHHEYGTQNERGREIKRRNRLHNRALFVDHWGPQLHRQVLVDRLHGRRAWSEEPVHIAITVTRDDPDAGYGDYYTARELGGALIAMGAHVSYIERYDDRWYDLDPSIDVVVVLLDVFDLRRIPRGVVSVAWVRNWTDRWIGRRWFADYDIVLASSQRTKELVERDSPKVAHLFPLATNPERFLAEGSSTGSPLAVFSGNYWGKPRAIIDALRGLPDRFDVDVHGANWDEVDGVRRFAAGHVDYQELPGVYRGAGAVLDDTAEHTAPYRAVNSRVFDAIATGTPVITDNPEGLAELLGDEHADDLLAWDDPASLVAQLEWVQDNPVEAAERAQRWREVVVRDHTYARRADQLLELLVDHVSAVGVGIAIGVPRDEERHRWGDEHFARDLQRQFERAGHPCRVLILPEWDEAQAARDDVVLHLFGLSELRPRPAQTTVLWNISHPELVTPVLVDRYDVAFCAGRVFTDELAARAVAPVHYLPQATDPDRFRPDPADAPAHDLLFVGNSRKVRRRVVDDVVAVLDRLPGSPSLAVYGADWTPDLLSQRHLAGDHVDNDRLGSYYAAATVVLNDHWEDMRERGFLSNRLYDALAAGAFVVSDHVDGMDEQFEGAVASYRDRSDLAAVLSHHLEHPDERAQGARRGREIILARHTFRHRVETILEIVGSLRHDRGTSTHVTSGATP